MTAPVGVRENEGGRGLLGGRRGLACMKGDRVSGWVDALAVC